MWILKETSMDSEQAWKPSEHGFSEEVSLKPSPRGPPDTSCFEREQKCGLFDTDGRQKCEVSGGPQGVDAALNRHKYGRFKSRLPAS